MAEIFDRTQSLPILGVPHLDPAIHILQFNARASAGQFAAQIVAHKPMMVHMQSEVVVDAPRDRAGVDISLRV